MADHIGVQGLHGWEYRVGGEGFKASQNEGNNLGGPIIRIIVYWSL